MAPGHTLNVAERVQSPHSQPPHCPAFVIHLHNHTQGPQGASGGCTGHTGARRREGKFSLAGPGGLGGLGGLGCKGSARRGFTLLGCESPRGLRPKLHPPPSWCRPGLVLGNTQDTSDAFPSLTHSRICSCTQSAPIACCSVLGAGSGRCPGSHSTSPYKSRSGGKEGKSAS